MKAPAQTQPRELLASTWVLVLSWNGWADTEACLESLEPIAERGAPVLLIDNGSEDGTPARVSRRFPWAEILENGVNLGFPGGNNRGIELAMSRGAQYIVLLNNDTVVDSQFLDELIAAAREHPEAGFFSSKIYFLDHPTRLWFAGSRLGRFTGHTPMLGHGEVDRGQYDSVGRIDLFSACSVLIPRPVFEAIGLLDESLFLYCEEVDLILRGEAAGFTAQLVPSSRVWHRAMPGTGGRATGRYLYYSTRNMLYILNHHLAIRNWPKRFARNSAVVLTLFASIFSQRLLFRPAFRSLRQGVRDYRGGQMGPRGQGRIL